MVPPRRRAWLSVGQTPSQGQIRRRSRRRRSHNRRPLLQQLETRELLAAALGLTNTNNLIQFDTATPGTVSSSTLITGFGAGESLVGIDFRPANGLLYLLTDDAANVGRLYTLDTGTGVATPVATLAADPADLTNPYTTLSGTHFGVDFNPVPDRLRVVSDSGQNLRINPANGLVTTDAALNPGAPTVAGVAYTNNFAGATSTTLFDIDFTTNRLLIQNPPNNGTLVDVGALGVDVSAVMGFDILTTGDRAAPLNTAYASFQVGGSTGLYTINLSTGAATLVGGIGGSPTLTDMVIAPNPSAVVQAANGVGFDASNNLLQFNTATPGTIASSTPVTGLGAGESLIGIDFRPADGLLYALTDDAANVGRLYTINTTTAAATLVATLAADPADLTNPYTSLAGASFGVDFNPVADRLRVDSDTGQNLRINPTSGLVTTDADLNPGTPNIAGVAYTNSFIGASSTTLFAIDSTTDQLLIQNPPNNGTLTAVGSLGVDVSSVLGFDIRAGLNTALATFVVGGTPGLYSIDLTTGAATLIGAIGGGTSLGGFSLVPEGEFRFTSPTYSVSEAGNFVVVSIERVGGSDSTVSATFKTANGTAFAPGDYQAQTITLTFLSGAVGPATIAIPVFDNAAITGNKTFTVQLSNAIGGVVIGAPSTATVTIVDDDVPAANAYGISGGTNLVRYAVTAPGTIISSIPITGLQAGESILGIDFRPVNNTLYGLGSSGRIYQIDRVTGVAAGIVLVADPSDPTPFTGLVGTSFGVDFNPAVDRLRVVSDANQNLRINVDTGTVISDSDVNPGDPNVAGIAYSNDAPFAPATTLYDIDTVTDTLLIQNPPNSGTLVPVGPLGVDASDVAGFDILTVGGVNTALATLVVGGTTGLYVINLTTGAANPLGAVGAPVTALAVVPQSVSATLVGTTATLTGTAGADAIVIGASGGLLRHNLFSTGNGGFNSDFDFDSTTPGDQTLSASDPSVIVNINSGNGDDHVTIGDAGAAASTFAATFNIDGGGGNNELTLDDTASATVRTIAITGGSVTGLGGPINYSHLAVLDLNAGTGGDTVNVNSTSAATNVNTGDGDDTVAFADGATLSGGLLDGGGGVNTLSYAAYTSPVAVDLSSTEDLFVARISGVNEPGPLSASQASGYGTFALNTAQTELSFLINYFNLEGATIVGEHFHNGPIGANGPIVRGLLPTEEGGLTVPNGTAQGVWSSSDAQALTPALVAELLAGRIYWNIHTNLSPSGEMRGQLVPVGAWSQATGTAGVRGFDNVTGGANDDQIVGNANANILHGGGGRDRLVGFRNPAGTFDQLFGDADDDTLVWNNGDGNDVMEGGSGTDEVEVNGSPVGGDAFLLQVSSADPTRLRFDRTNLGLFNLDIGTVESLDFDTLGGDDTTTIEFANGNPIPVGGLDYDGGAGANSLVLQRSSGSFAATNESYVATGPGAGAITLDGAPVTFSNLAPINDTVPSANFTFTAPPGPQTVNVVNGPPVSGFQTTQVASGDTPPGWELINFANKTNATISTQGGDDAVTLNNPAPATGLASLTLNTGGGADAIDVLATAPTIPTAVNAGTGNDVVNVIAAGLGAGSTLTANGGPGIDTLNVDAGGATANLSGSTITIGTTSIAFSNFESVNIQNALGAPVVPVTPPLPVNAIEGTPVQNVTVARFTDADPGAKAADYVATIDWGDGTTTAGAITADASSPTVFFVTGSHTYAEEGPFTVTTTILDQGGSFVSTTGGTTVTITFTPEPPVNTTSPATVTDAPLASKGATVTKVEGVSLTGVVATFTDSGGGEPVGNYTPTIDWGDGTTTSGTIGAVGSPSGVTFTVTGTHTYALSGSYPLTVTIADEGGAQTIAQGLAVITPAPLVATGTAVATTEGQAFTGQVATFTDVPAGSLSDYKAVIYWGDGRPATAGAITQPGGPGSPFSVAGSHVYRDANVNGGTGSFAITIFVSDKDGAFTTVTTTATVADRPIVLTGRLSPKSDHGKSSSDGITNVNQPEFVGTSEPFSIITVTASRVGAPGSFKIGTTTADASGAWSLTSARLADGKYAIKASAIDASHHTTASIQVMPKPGVGSLVIDTSGPKVTGLSFERSTGQLVITFRDDRSGLDQHSLVDGAEFAFTKFKARPGQFLITSLQTTPAASATGEQSVTAVINNGHALRGGTYLLTIKSRGLRDVAGNALDGDFFGFFASGDQRPGGDFVAVLDTIHRTIFPPSPQDSSATPNVPAGSRPPVTTFAKAASQSASIRTSGVQPARQALAAARVHDAAIADLAHRPIRRR